MVCTFISPPKWGAAREVHHSWASRRSRVLTIPDHQVEGSFWWEGGSSTFGTLAAAWGTSHLLSVFR